ncbi:hypothetical protein PACTADRAFT_48435 [Pachysolen tannophilus NRRL Y-2460]|uniref:Major facilitator superfamily (MFS) profile domain-containing protein n=1 Tax=Pachysolen tannophilus NRRL Y-2460 TaxID=669874 RepID=A0A1E4TY02_PACTA|nr:hypothetical protein PACTADRAFT_48435 [Pachysolen tannophilus NRRL Y-2460]
MHSDHEETESLLGLKPTFSPTIINDASSAVPGVIANELTQEPNYGAVETGSLDGENGEGLEDDEYAVPPPRLWFIMSSIMMCAYLSALDTTVVTTLLTVIASDIDALPRMSLIGTSYLLSCSAFQPLFGKLSDIFGRKTMLLVCDFSFAVGCLICGFSNSLWPLVIGRFISGIGGGGMTTLGTITMSDLVSLRKRGLFQGFANIFFAIGASSGGLIGGLVADNFGWRWVFIFQAPLAIIGATLIILFLKLPEGSQGLGVQGHDMISKVKKIDFLGSTLLVLSLTGIISAAAFGGKDIPYNGSIFITLCVFSGATLLSFGYVELYISKEPTIPVHLLADKSVLFCALSNWFYTMAIFGVLYYVPVYFTTVLSLDATQSGLRMIPNFFVASAASVLSGMYMKKTGKYLNFTKITGFVSVIGIFLICFITPKIDTFYQFFLLSLPTFGYATVLTVSLSALIASVPVHYQASTTSIQYAFRAVGSTLGLSISSAIFQHRLENALFSNISKVVPSPDVDIAKIVAKAMESAEYMKIAPEWSVQAIRDSYGAGCHASFWFGLVVIILGYICCTNIEEHQLHSGLSRK